MAAVTMTTANPVPQSSMDNAVESKVLYAAALPFLLAEPSLGVVRAFKLNDKVVENNNSNNARFI